MAELESKGDTPVAAILTEIHRTTRLRFEVRCRNACTPPAAQDTTAAVVLTVHRAASVWLEGIEITQGVQHFRAAEHLPQIAQPSLKCLEIHDHIA